MATGDNEVNIKFGATIDELKSKMGEAGVAVREFAKNSAERVDALNKAIAGIQVAFAAIAELATLGFIGEKFAELGVRTAEYAEKLSLAAQITGIASGQLAALGYAASTVGLSTESLQRGLVLLSRNMVNVSQAGGHVAAAFEAIGLSAEQVKSMSPEQVLKRTAEVFSKTNDGATKTALAMALFGRSGAQLIPLLNKGTEGMAELTDKAKSLGLVLSDEANEQALQFAEKMKEVHGATKGLSLTIGQELVPYLNAMATAFVQTASDGQTFKGVGEAIGTVLRTVTFAAGAVWLTLKDMGDSIGALAAQAVAAAHLDLDAVRAIGAARDKEAAANEAAFERMKKALYDYQDAAKAVGADDGKPKGAKKTDINFDPNATANAKTAQSEAAKIAAATEALLKAQLTADNALQKEYLAEAQSIYDEAYKHGEISAQQYWDAKLAISLEGIDQEMAAKRKELEGTKALEAAAGTQEQKLKFQAQEATLQGAINVLLEKRTATIRANAAAAADAQKALASDLAAFQSSQNQASGDGRVAAEQATLAQLKALRQISTQDAFALDKQYEDESYGILLQSLSDKAAAIKGNDLEQQKAREALQLQAEAAARTHEAKLTQISNSAEMDRQKYSLQAQQSVQSSFSTMVNDMLSGTKKLSDVFRNFGISIANTFTNLIAQKFTDQLFDVSGVNKLMDKMVGFVTDGLQKIVSKWGISETTKTAASTSGAAARTAVSAGEQATTQTGTLTTAAVVETAQAVQTGATVAGAGIRTTTEVAAAATGKSLTIGGAITAIGAKAWEAAASVYAAIAAIPYVGPFLAPVMAVAAGAAVLGFAANIASSEGGEYQVPQDRLNFVHKDETILPAPFAQGLRQLVGDGGVAPVLDAVEEIQRSFQPGVAQPPGGTNAGAPTALPRNSLPTALPSSIGAAARINTALTAPAGGANGGPGMQRGGDTFHFNLSAIDGQNAKQFILDNGKHVATALQAQVRNFRPATT